MNCNNMFATRTPPPIAPTCGPLPVAQQRRLGAITAHSTHSVPVTRVCTASARRSSVGSNTNTVGSRRTRKDQRMRSTVTHMGIRAIETYDSAFQLEPEAEMKLRELLSTPTFCVQVG